MQTDCVTRQRLSLYLRHLYTAAFAFSVMLTLPSLQAQSSINSGPFPADAGLINVSDAFFGAVPNDGLDDTAAIQKVFDLITPSGQIVYFPAGTYRLRDEIYLRKTDFQSQAEALPNTGWTQVQEGGRTFMRASGASSDPNLAAKLSFRFDAIKAQRALRMTYRVLSANQNSFYYRINSGPWRINPRPFNGNAAWRENAVVATDLELLTGSNVLEIAARDNGFELDVLAMSYLGNYLNNTILQGESRDSTILKLDDNLTVAGSAFNKAMLRWEPGVEQFFRTAVRDLSFDVGAGNPQADGLKFHGNNQSTVHNVRFQAAPDSGDVALDLQHTDAIGPILVRQIVVDGFNVGIHSAWQNASRTFEDIVLRNQRSYGWVNEAASTIWVRKLRSENRVPAFYNGAWRLPGDGQGRVALLDAELIGLPGAETQTAMESLGAMYMTRVRVTGYQKAMSNQNQAPFRAYRGQDGIFGSWAEEWWSTGAYAGEGGGMTRQFETPDTQLRLPIEETPTVPWDALSAWDGPQRHVIEISPGVFSGFPNDTVDDTRSLQAAIDSGASTVYVPHGRWIINGQVQLRANVRRLIGCEAELTASDFLTRGRIVIGELGPPVIVIERFANFGFAGLEPRFEHASMRTVVMNNLTGLNYRPVASNVGKLFLNDTVGNAIVFAANQKVYARQLNIEENTTLPTASAEARLLNQGGQAWIFGFKTEQSGVIAKTTAGGATEIVGNLQLNNFGASTVQYIVEDASFSAVINIKPYPEAGTTYGRVQEVRAGVSRTTDFKGVGYIGFSALKLWQLHQEVIIDNNDPEATYTGVWANSDSFPRGHIGENFAFAGAGANRVTYTPNLPAAGRYRVYTRWIGNWPGQDHSNHASNASYTVMDRNGSQPVVLDQTRYSDGWYLLGEFDFAAGNAGSVSLSAQGANGKVNTDGVRFVRLGENFFASGFE